MKTKFLLLFVCTYTLTFAQLKHFTDPEFGKFEPRFLYSDYLIGNNYSENGTWNGIHKLNLINGATTQFSFGDQGSFAIPRGIPQTSTHQDDIYVDLNYGHRKISINDNFVYDSDVDTYTSSNGVQHSVIRGSIFNGRCYTFDHQYGGTMYYNLDNKEIVFVTGYPPSTEARFFNFLPRDTYMLAVGSLNYPSVLSGLMKVSLNPDIQDYYFLGTEDAYITGLHPFSPNSKVMANGRELMLAQLSNGYNRLISISPAGIYNSYFISGNLHINVQMNYIKLVDGVIFNFDGQFYKTNGSSTLEEIETFNNIGLIDTGGFHTPSPYNLFQPSGVGNSFVQVENTTYFNMRGNDQVERIYKMKSIDETPELVYTAVHEGFVYEIINHAIEWNGNLVFVVKSNDSTVADKIYLYNGTELILNPNLNTYCENCKATTNENHKITGLFSNESLLLVFTEDGTFSIDYEETMSTSENTTSSKLKIYPNPVSDNLYFSEKLSDIQIFDISGKNVSSIKGNQTELNVENLPKGNYMLKGKIESGKTVSLKFIKK